MGELARERSTRDLRVTRSHLGAAIMAVILLAASCFGAGWAAAGRPAAVPARATALGDAPDDALVDLLARIDASADARGGVDALTFPDALRGQEGSEVSAPHGPAGILREPQRIETAGFAGVDGDAPPDGRFTLEVARLHDGSAASALAAELGDSELDVWTAALRVAGQPEHRVAVGAYVRESEAIAELDVVQAVVGSAHAVRVVPIH